MSAEHDKLTTIIHDAQWTDGKKFHRTDWQLADAILADGYRKPRTITTAEELDALAVGSSVLCIDSKGDGHPAQKGEHGWRLAFVDALWGAEKLLSGSCTIQVINEWPA
ncbi:hypothetical protein [Arthrobacter sp. EpRS71]|uniref:hypothetical protein n=1 Tax=Arthrobacter sp. EpRS71 TaxID=1743141 RepID=UPI0007486DAE|nr:hypothetical protein [Arthrobacter sp. EpRS71]KUM34577.1 hypothetical protein AR689_10575 [Arthrobacter sp. EpRS71]